MSNQPTSSSGPNQFAQNISGSGTEEWTGKKLLGNLGTFMPLRHGFVIITGTLEAGKNIDNMPSFRITTYDSQDNSQSEHEILMDRMFLTQGVKVDDKVELHGARTKRGFIKTIAILNLATGVKTGKLTYYRPWLFLLGLLLVIIGIVISHKEKSAPLYILIGVLFLLAFPIMKRRRKFISEP